MRRSWLAGWTMLVVTTSSVSCKDDDDDDDDVSVCEQAIEASEDEIACGRYDSPDDDPCAEPVNAEACANQQARNDAVVECVLGAASDEVAFVYQLRTGDRDGQYGATTTTHVTADGTMWSERHDYADLCSMSITEVYEAVSLEGCTHWDCVRTRVRQAGRVEECSQTQDCEGL